MSVSLVRADARALPLDDASVDLVVTSPPYFGLRSYEDDGEEYGGQIGLEATVAEFIDALIASTREMSRVLKASGSIWINLGDRYLARGLAGVPWRFALRVQDELGLTLREEVIWSKPNGFIDAKARDRFRRTHETWFHFTKADDYYADIDAIRDAPSDYQARPQYRRARELFAAAGLTPEHEAAVRSVGIIDSRGGSVRSGGSWESGAGKLALEVKAALGSYYRELCGSSADPIGKVPGSVQEVAAHPFKIPASLGLDGHFATYPVEWPGLLIKGFSPLGGVVLDPFGGTGTTALAACVLGREGISVDLSADYGRIAAWRTADSDQRARAAKRLSQGADT